MTPRDAYAELVRRSRERAVLSSCLEVLGWDELTYMPHGGVENRGRQTAHLAGLLHRQATDARVGELLALADDPSLTGDSLSAEAVNLREWRRDYERLARIPQSLVEEIAAVATTAQHVWADARQNDDFRAFLPWLERVIALKREEAAHLQHGGTLYDALLDEYEPGAKAAELMPVLLALRDELRTLLADVGRSRRRSRVAILRRPFPLDRQRLFVETVAADIGFDFSRGRFDTTTHPFFCAVGPGDCRITTRFSHADFGEGFFAAVHEIGHGLYEQGLDAAHYGTPLGEASSMSIHESQSRLWENCVARTRAFWQHFFPRAREMFHDVLHDVKLDDFHRAVNHVQPGWHRVRADAASYDLHILVRVELEQALISGDLAPADLPAAWSEGYRNLLGVVPTNDAEGCLQDGHWGAGQFGYFPTYTLGNLVAAQLIAKARADLGDFDGPITRGEFEPLREWLADRIYRHGRRYPARELVQRATGQPLDHRALVASLRERYAELYGL